MTAGGLGAANEKRRTKRDGRQTDRLLSPLSILRILGLLSILSILGLLSILSILGLLSPLSPLIIRGRDG